MHQHHILKLPTPHTETSPLLPRSPYGCAKGFAFILTKYYRDVFGLFASTAIFYNHESPRRTEEYVTRKITKAAVRISKGLQNELFLGDLSAKIDYGYAKEYMEAAWKIMQLDKPDDFIICTGESHTVQEFLEEVFNYLKLNYKKYVKYDPRFKRAGKLELLEGDNSKARKIIGFDPKFKFKEIVKLMIKHDIKEVERELLMDEKQKEVD